VSEYEVEPIPGLPDHLPDGERILWQGKPEPLALARRALHARKVAIYFGVVAAWMGGEALLSGAGLAVASGEALSQIAIGTLAVLLLLLFAWLMSRSTVYTITNRRVVARFGVALPMSVNLPFSKIVSAELRVHGKGAGDICLRMEADQRLSYLLFWPHVRPWAFSPPQPTLRCVGDVESVASLLSDALATSSESGQTRPVGQVRSAGEGATGFELAAQAGR
jgi:hypothetical protein